MEGRTFETDFTRSTQKSQPKNIQATLNSDTPQTRNLQKQCLIFGRIDVASAA